jgi:hypothetical protein
VHPPPGHRQGRCGADRVASREGRSDRMVRWLSGEREAGGELGEGGGGVGIEWVGGTAAEGVAGAEGEGQRGHEAGEPLTVRRAQPRVENAGVRREEVGDGGDGARGARDVGCPAAAPRCQIH